MILKKNLTNLSIINKAKIFNDKAEKVLNNKLVQKFDICFLDPPFNDDEYMKNLIHIKMKIYLQQITLSSFIEKKGAWIIYQK